MTSRTRRAAAAILKRYEDTLYEYHFRGGGDPDFVPYWEDQYARARERMLKHLMGEQPHVGVTNPEPMSEEEVDFHRRNGTIV